MIITYRFAIYLALGGLPLAFSGLIPVAGWLGLLYTAAVFVAGLADWFMSADSSSVEAERQCEDKLSIGASNPITISIRSKSKQLLDMTIRDEPPYVFSIDGNVFKTKLTPNTRYEKTYHVTPRSRGDFEFGDLFIRFKGPLGLVIRQCRIPLSRPVKVYPNLLDIKKYDLMMHKGRAQESGSRKIRLYGRGTEFESLRDYVPDDEFRQVDWKASARRGRLISRQYQVERSQNIIIMLDAGRTMSVRVEDMSKLDYAINSALMLAYAAAAEDDKVGLLTFSRKVDLFLPPAKGRTQALTIMQALYNIPLTTDESDYGKAFLHLAHRWRKRSLVVVFTDLLDPESSRQIILNLQTLASTHLCMCVAITDSNVTAAARSVPTDSTQIYEKAAAVEMLNERQQAIAVLQRAGVVVVDSEPGSLSPAVINQYLRIKTRIKL